ncbi:MAG TPA: hypothetical protein VEV17_18615 [Bryobacteraceae bacterium]|nr:hypothetical protein [Bryobacteraceae bacterium]
MNRSTVRKPEELPEWVNETPASCDYSLLMFDWDGDHRQEVELSREEFITLKKHLARLRRLIPTTRKEPAKTKRRVAGKLRQARRRERKVAA